MMEQVMNIYHCDKSYLHGLLKAFLVNWHLKRDVR